MIKGEAIQAMEQGKKVTHRYFSHDEYITMIGGVVIDEYGHEHQNFWHWHSGKHFEMDWSIWEENNHTKP